MATGWHEQLVEEAGMTDLNKLVELKRRTEKLRKSKAFRDVEDALHDTRETSGLMLTIEIEAFEDRNTSVHFKKGDFVW